MERNGAGTASPAAAADAAAPTFRDPELEARFRTEGYVVVDLIDPHDVAELRRVCEQVHADPKPGYDSDFFSPDPQVKRVVNDLLARAMAPGIDRHLVGHRSMLHAFVVNWPGPRSGLVLHQHTSVVDERRFRSLVAWCGVTAADEANGTLHLVPRSHLVQRGPHPERARSWAEDHHAQLMADHLVSVPVGPGQAILFDNQLLHCSVQNVTAAPRLSAVAVVVPRAAEPHYYEATDHGTVRIYRLDTEFFLQHTAGDFAWPGPDGLDLLEEVPFTPTALHPTEVADLLPAGSCPHPAP
jgi:hypothetical protein